MSSYEIITTHDGKPLRTARFEPVAEPVGVIQILHGFGEGIEHYMATAEFFNAAGFACVIHDQRGFGKIPKKKARGIAPGYDCFLEDVKTVRSQISGWYPGLPVILFGFSMGGNIIINYLLRYPQTQYEKVILESPWFRLYRRLPEFAKVIAAYIGKISCKPAISTKLNVNVLSRDLDKMNILKDYNIFHDRISLRLFTEMTSAGEYAIKNAANITVPMLLLCAGEDKIVSPVAIREFSGNAKENVTLKEYPDAYHYLHLDTIGGEVLDEMLSFINA